MFHAYYAPMCDPVGVHNWHSFIFIWFAIAYACTASLYPSFYFTVRVLSRFFSIIIYPFKSGCEHFLYVLYCSLPLVGNGIDVTVKCMCVILAVYGIVGFVLFFFYHDLSGGILRLKQSNSRKITLTRDRDLAMSYHMEIHLVINSTSNLSAI